MFPFLPRFRFVEMVERSRDYGSREKDRRQLARLLTEKHYDGRGCDVFEASNRCDETIIAPNSLSRIQDRVCEINQFDSAR